MGRVAFLFIEVPKLPTRSTTPPHRCIVFAERGVKDPLSGLIGATLSPPANLARKQNRQIGPRRKWALV
jgi:hypothetical protein